MKRTTHPIAYLILFPALAAILLTARAESEEPSPVSTEDCTVRPSGTTTQVVICPPGLDMHAWRTAGIKACQSIQNCTALIWDDPVKAPQIPPLPGAELPKEQATSLVAMWINESQDMVLVSPVKK